MRKVKGKDLKVGDLTSRGLIIEIDGRLDFYEGKPNMTFVDINDPYFGPLIGERFPEDDYEILHERGTPEYRKVLIRMMRECMDHARDKMKDVVIIEGILNEKDS